MNKNAKFKVINQRPLEECSEIGVQMDADIELEYYCPETKTIRKTISRMVAYIDPVDGKKLFFLTNLLELKASTICLLYKNRWIIEPLFKQIKQNFELTYFLSDSQEGIKTQIWIAMILNLIFTVIHKMIKEAEDFATMVKLAGKNTASYVGFIKFLQMSQQQISNALGDIGKVQLNLFDENPRALIENSS